jgi:hypothetical protein
VDQHGLHLDLDSLPGAVTGRADALGPPVHVPCVRFNVLRFADLPAQRRDSTIAHEVAHAVGVVHHGRGAHWEKVPITLPDGTAVTANVFVTCDGSQHSGAEDCLMRYRAADFIERRPGDPKSWVPYGDPEPPGTRLCISRRATGVNAPPQSKCGAASEGRGDCWSQLRVSDVYPQAEAPD